MFTKQQFYNHIRDKANSNNNHIQFYLRFEAEEISCELIFDWRNILATGHFNPVLYCQLVNRKAESLRGKYISQDLHIDLIANKLTTDYKVFKYLDKWCREAIEKYKIEEATDSEKSKRNYQE